jgi:hypothetical protein
MVESFFNQDYVEKLKPYIRETVQRLLDNMASKGCKEPVDLIEKFALPVPSYVCSSITSKDVKSYSETNIGLRLSTPFWEFLLKIWNILPNRMPFAAMEVVPLRRPPLPISMPKHNGFTVETNLSPGSFWTILPRLLISDQRNQRMT